MDNSPGKTKGKRRPKSYTKGELNRAIDDLIHPLFKIDGGFVLVDGVLHGLIEQNPPQSVRKFIKYNLPAIMKEVGKLLK